MWTKPFEQSKSCTCTSTLCSLENESNQLPPDATQDLQKPANEYIAFRPRPVPESPSHDHLRFHPYVESLLDYLLPLALAAVLSPDLRRCLEDFVTRDGGEGRRVGTRAYESPGASLQAYRSSDTSSGSRLCVRSSVLGALKHCSLRTRIQRHLARQHPALEQAASPPCFVVGYSKPDDGIRERVQQHYLEVLASLPLRAGWSAQPWMRRRWRDVVWLALSMYPVLLSSSCAQRYGAPHFLATVALVHQY